jgi:acetyl-CoA carboxylase biotin carboxyl carrier protein
MGLDDDDVRAILQLLDASAFDELELQTDRFQLTLRRADGAWTRETRTLGVPRELPATGSAAKATPAANDPAPPGPPPLPGTTPGTHPSLPADPSLPASPGAPPSGWAEVASPLPGTFYRSPKPGAPPFVELGARVERDTVVAIVETMKLMNSIYAGTAGRIAEFCLADATFAAQDAVLMRIAPGPAPELMPQPASERA